MRASFAHSEGSEDVSKRVRGVLIAAFGVVCGAPNAVIIRLIVQETGASNQLVVFWKSFNKICLTVALMAWTKGWREALAGARRGPWYLFAATCADACITLGFNNMILLTTVARAMLFYSLNPLFAALVGRTLLKDKLERRTVAALLAAGAAIGLIFIPEIASSTKASRNEEAAQSDLGDIIAVGTGFAMAMYILIVRAAHRHDPEIYMVPASSGGSMVAACLAATSLATGVFNNDSGGSGGAGAGAGTRNPFLPPSAPTQFWFLIVVDAAGVAIMLVCLTVAPRYCSSAEVSLMTLLETVLGPFIVFVVLGEEPGQWTAIGGTLLLCTLIAHECKSEMLPTTLVSMLFGAKDKLAIEQNPVSDWEILDELRGEAGIEMTEGFGREHSNSTFGSSNPMVTSSNPMRTKDADKPHMGLITSLQNSTQAGPSSSSVAMPMRAERSSSNVAMPMRAERSSSNVTMPMRAERSSSNVAMPMRAERSSSSSDRRSRGFSFVRSLRRGSIEEEDQPLRGSGLTINKLTTDMQWVERKLALSEDESSLRM